MAVGATAASPTPNRVTVCVEPAMPPALSVNTRLAWRPPAAVGLKVNEKVQLAAAAKVAAQVWVWAKSAALAPVIAIADIASTPAPELVRVTTCAALVEAMVWSV